MALGEREGDGGRGQRVLAGELVVESPSSGKPVHGAERGLARSESLPKYLVRKESVVREEREDRGGERVGERNDKGPVDSGHAS